MAFRKYAQSFLVLLMLVLPVAAARHSAVHALEQARTQKQDDDGKHHAELCGLCILSKDFSKSLAAAPPAIAVPVFAETVSASPVARVHPRGTSSPYAARAPPSFSA